MTYFDEFQEAIKRSERFGLKTPRFFLESKRCFTQETINQIPYLIRDAFGELDICDLSARCIPMHYVMKDCIERALGVPFYFTLGYFTLGNKDVYLQTEESLKQQIEDGVNPFSVNLHAWLTSSSLEILDVTLPTTIAEINHDPRTMGGIITKHYSDLSEDLAYHPMLVGVDYLKKLGFNFFI